MHFKVLQSRQTNWKPIWNSILNFTFHYSFHELWVNLVSFCFSVVFILFSFFFLLEMMEQTGKCKKKFKKQDCNFWLCLEVSENRVAAFNCSVLYISFRNYILFEGCSLEKWFCKEKDNGIAGFTAKGRKILRSVYKRRKQSVKDVINNHFYLFHYEIYYYEERNSSLFQTNSRMKHIHKFLCFPLFFLFRPLNSLLRSKLASIAGLSLYQYRLQSGSHNTCLRTGRENITSVVQEGNVNLYQKIMHGKVCDGCGLWLCS